MEECDDDDQLQQEVKPQEVLQQIAELPGDFRVRLSSIEATEVTRELIAVMAA